MISPYIHFQGNCREAMQTYQAIFGGDLQLMTYGEMPQPEERHKGSTLVMHSALMTPDVGNLAASDFPPGVTGDPQQAVSISVELKTAERAQEVYAALVDGGDVVFPMGPSFFSPAFGMLKDRFGTHWIVMATPAQG